MSAATDLAATRAALAARLDDLGARTARIEADLAEPISRDWEEAATEQEDDEALMGEDAVLAREMAAISAAIARIDEGSYGSCARCGEDIAPARLAAIPEAALCIGCARHAEAH